MIQIRAGILYNLAIEDINRINDYIMRDVLYQNSLIDKYTRYSYYFYLTNIYTPDSCKDCYDDFSLNKLFAEDIELFVDMFSKDGFSLEQICHMCSILDEAIPEFADIKYDIIIDDWMKSTGDGIHYEKKALNMLAYLEFQIAECEGKEIMWGDFISLHGKADGVIISSPGNIYKPGTLIEIKYKGNNDKRSQKKYYQKDIAQIAAYSVIFDCDVLYVCIFSDEHIECELITKAELRKRFEAKMERVIKNCKHIMQLYNSDEISDIKTLVDLCKHKRKKQLFAENID